MMSSTKRKNKRKNVPFISIIIANYNSLEFKKLLDEFFESVFNLNYPRNRYEVIVVDNGSQDGSFEYIKRNYPKAKVVKLDKNYGFAKANNLGASLSRGEFLALINNDTVLDTNWLMEMARYAIKEPNAIYGSVMLKYGSKDTILYYGGKLLAWRFPRHLRTWEKDVVEVDKPFLTFYADGCGLLISKDLFLKLGGFDEEYFCVAEDYELSWKAWLMGYKVYLVPSAKFYHKVSATMGAFSQLHMYLLWRNQLRNIMKFAETRNMMFVFYLSALYAVLFSVGLLCYIERKPYLVFSISKAFLRVLCELPELMKKRMYFQNIRKIEDNMLKKMGLVLTFKESIHEEVKALMRRKKIISL